MKKINLLLWFCSMVLVVLSSCTYTESNQASDYSGGFETNRAHETRIESEALSAAQRFIKKEYAYDADFHERETIIQATAVENRYKIMQRFDSKSRDEHNLVYRIWVQKFPSGWEFGNLGIERKGGTRLYTTNGRMKEMERKAATRTEDCVAGDVKYTIIKRNAPNYVIVYTESRLTRDKILRVFNQLKDDYESVRFSTSRNPENEDYLAIQSGLVFEYDIDKITKLENY